MTIYQYRDGFTPPSNAEDIERDILGYIKSVPLEMEKSIEGALDKVIKSEDLSPDMRGLDQYFWVKHTINKADWKWYNPLKTFSPPSIGFTIRYFDGILKEKDMESLISSTISILYRDAVIIGDTRRSRNERDIILRFRESRFVKLIVSKFPEAKVLLDNRDPYLDWD